MGKKKAITKRSVAKKAAGKRTKPKKSNSKRTVISTRKVRRQKTRKSVKTRKRAMRPRPVTRKEAQFSEASQEFRYHGHSVLAVDQAEQAAPMLQIDAMKVDVRREEGGGYSTSLLMFATYPALGALARSVIDHSPVFLALKGKPAPPSSGGMRGMG
jgi:hypothetical protein